VTTLRARKRQRLQAEILAAARELFAERGFHGTSMVAIADRAEVAEATVYNHFRSKGALLLTLATRHYAARIAEYGRRFDPPEADPVELVLAFLGKTIDWTLEIFDRELWRNVHAMHITHVSGEDEQAFFRMDDMLEGEIKALIERLKRVRKLPATVDSDQLGALAWAIFNNQWHRFLSYDEVTPEAIKAMIAAQLGRAMRNEIARGAQ
jgi:AcrR family transcriptional regulator